MRTVIAALLPRGPIWRPVIGADFDNLLTGIATNWRTVQEFLGFLAHIRDPYLTNILSDLEKEYGVLPESTATDSERRQTLAAVKYAKPGTGTDDDLETMLRAAGFDVNVYRNDPPIDPALLINQFQMIAGNTIAVCGNENSYCGLYGGDLVVNGDLYDQLPAPYTAQCGGGTYAGNATATCGYFIATLWRDLVVYGIPTDPDVWRFIFFVGGAASGWAPLNDWNMEKSGVSDWTRGDSTVLEKTKSVPPVVFDSMTLRVIGGRNTDQQTFETEQPDPSLVMSALMDKTLSSDVHNVAWLNFLNDGDMERPNTTAWTVSGSAVLSKQTATPYAGKYYLRVAYGGGTFPAARALNALRTSGRTYRIIGAARGDGVIGVPEITNVALSVWIGTSSTTWQPFDVTFTSVGLDIYLRDGTVGSTGFVEFDNVAIYELVDLIDGDMEAATTAAYTAGNSATLTKSTSSPYTGTRALRVTHNGVNDPYAYQSILAAAQRYRVRGFMRSNGSAIPNIRFGTSVKWIGYNSVEWQQFEFVTTSGASTEFRLVAVTSTVGDWVEFDDITIEPLLPTEYTPTGLSNTFTAKGKAIEFDGVSDWIDAGNIADYTDNFTLAAWIETETSADRAILARQDGINSQYALGVGSTGVVGFYDGVSLFAGSVTVNDGKPHLVAVVIDGANSQIYVDGQPDGSTFSPSITSFTLNLEIGSTFIGTAAFWQGIIQQPLIYSTALSAAEIEALYDLGKEVALNGSYAEQRLDETITEATPITGQAWGDPRIAVPMVAIYDPVLLDWVPIWVGSNNNNEQSINAVAENGLAGIRLYNKFNESSGSNFDNIDITNPRIEPADVPNERIARLKEIILKVKPLRTWAGLIINPT